MPVAARSSLERSAHVFDLSTAVDRLGCSFEDAGSNVGPVTGSFRDDAIIDELYEGSGDAVGVGAGVGVGVGAGDGDGVEAFSLASTSALYPVDWLYSFFVMPVAARSSLERSAHDLAITLIIQNYLYCNLIANYLALITLP